MLPIRAGSVADGELFANDDIKQYGDIVDFDADSKYPKQPFLEGVKGGTVLWAAKNGSPLNNSITS